MKTPSTMLPDIPAPLEYPKVPSGEPVATREHQLTEYERVHNDLERFDLEDELWQPGLGVEELAESEDGTLEGDGFWDKVSTRTRLMGSELGMATAEYAITTLAAVGLAGLLVVILRSEEVRGFLLNVIRTALSLP